jgi:hypothetical protein
MIFDYILLLFTPILIIFSIAMIDLIFGKKDHSEDLLNLQKHLLKEKSDLKEKF